MDEQKCVLGSIGIGLVLYVVMTMAQEATENKKYHSLCRFKVPTVVIVSVTLYMLSSSMIRKI